METRKAHRRTPASIAGSLTLFSILLVSILLAACGSGSSADGTKSAQNNTASISINSSAHNITYTTDPHSVLIRTFYGGGNYGALELAPDVSIYGDGTFILGTQRQGQISTDTLQQLLHTLVDTYGLSTMKRLQFADTQDQNATFLELTLNGKATEFMYGSFGNQQESAQDMDEYHHLDKALLAINGALTGPTHPYTSNAFALLARRIFNSTQPVYDWSIYDFTLAQTVSYECSLDDYNPPDDTSLNRETACLKYTIPHNAILLTTTQVQIIKGQLQNASQGEFLEDGIPFEVTLRPLLPDEAITKTLAMFGSAQENVTAVPLFVQGQVPPVPTPTPSR